MPAKSPSNPHSNNPHSTSVAAGRNSFLLALAAIAVGALYLYHFYLVWTYSVDVPYRDEWEALTPGGLAPELSWRWLFELANEHRIVTTKFLVWILYHVNSWDLASHQMINFVLYGMLLVLLALLMRRFVPELPSWVTVAFLAFLLSPVNSDNHIMGYQSNVHFGLLFFVGALMLLFSETPSPLRVIAGSLCAVLAAYSQSSGVVTGAVALSLFTVFQVARMRRLTDPVQQKHEKLLLGLAGIIIVAGLGLWFLGYEKPANAPPSAMPYTAIFWDYFLNIVAFGFGIEAMSPFAGFICLVLVLVPVVGDLVRRRGAVPASTWGIAAGILATILVLAIIALGRAIGHGVEQSKASRYAEIGMMLIPFSAMAWHSFLSNRPRLQSAALGALWLFCFITFFHTWSKFGVYQAQFTERTAALNCVRRYYDGRGRGNCRALYPSPIPDRLDQAKKLNLSFYRTLMAGGAESIELPE